jgi:ATP-dependent RNA helicase DHX36|tara:strand:- start:8006 stop:8752 length:747 start_codon:yes stop_codon:yes gene_type:complete
MKVPARFIGEHKKINTQSRAVFMGTVVEPATKVTFPDTFDTHDNTKKMKCLGAGVRQKKIAIINVKVYAVALYADAEECKAELHSGKSLLDGKFHKALLIQLVRNVDGKTFWEALDDALAGRIREIATNMATAEDADGNFMATVAEAAEVAEERAMDGMDALKDLFSGANLKKDSRVLLNWKPGAVSDKTVTGFDGTIEIGVVGGDATVELQSMELARALFDVYLGDTPVSPDAKTAFEAGARGLSVE